MARKANEFYCEIDINWALIFHFHVLEYFPTLP